MKVLTATDHSTGMPIAVGYGTLYSLQFLKELPMDITPDIEKFESAALHLCRIRDIDPEQVLYEYQGVGYPGGVKAKDLFGLELVRFAKLMHVLREEGIF